jgi:hypothetical protein
MSKLSCEGCRAQEEVPQIDERRCANKVGKLGCFLSHADLLGSEIVTCSRAALIPNRTDYDQAVVRLHETEKRIKQIMKYRDENSVID